MKTFRLRQFALLSLMGFVVSPNLSAETNTNEQIDLEKITKGWKCKYCPDLSDEPWQVSIDVGLGYVSNDSYKYGEYNGLSEKGGYFKGGIEALYRDEEANYYNIQGTDLGLDSSYFSLEGGHQGSYKLKLVIDQITKYSLDTSRTPYRGDTTLTLPTGWVNGPTTADFTTLAADLRDVNFSTERRNLVLAGEFNTSPYTSYGVEFRRQTKEGKLPTGYTFGFASAAILPQVIDYTTDEVELSVKYNRNNFSGKLAFVNSTFKNAIDYIRWQNAYDTPDDVTDGFEGRAGTAPDNSMQQLLFSGRYSFDTVQLTGLLSVAQMTQDEAYEPTPYTENSALVTPDLPRTSLDGKVQVVNANLGAHWQYSPQQQWHTIFEHYEQDNKTARATYTYVIADSAVTGTPRANFPYSFRNQKLKIYTDYTTDSRMKLSGGGQLSRINRDYQSVERTEETTFWAKLSDRTENMLQYSIKAEHSDRSIDNYTVVAEVIQPDNPLMRKYNMADRNGQKLTFNLAYPATESLLLSFTGDVAQYDYDASQIGLTESDEQSLGLDMQYTVDEDLSFGAFIQNTNIKSKQAGSEALPFTADWTASNDDNVLTVGLSMNYQVIEDKFKLGLDYVHADASSSIEVSGGAPLPDLKTRRDTITLHGDYNVDENLTIKVSYQYEKYHEDNWYIDGVTPNTIPGALTLGETAPDYNIGAMWISLHYRF